MGRNKKILKMSDPSFYLKNLSKDLSVIEQLQELDKLVNVMDIKKRIKNDYFKILFEKA
jgi:hypothetical protein